MTRFDHAVSRLGSLLSGRRPLAKALINEDTLRALARGYAGRVSEMVFAQAQRLGHTTKLLPPPNPNRAEYPFVASMVYQGVPIDIEQRKGDTREGVDADGTPWKVTMHAHYGEVRSHARGASGVMGARGMDGDRLDVYIGDDPRSDLVVVVDQRIPETGEHDEQKVMLGFSTVDEALACYRKQYTKPGFYGGHTTMGIDDFRAKIADSSNAGKALKKALADLPPGSLLLPEAHGRLAFFAMLMKGRAHKYIKRVPYTKANGKRGWRYYYHAAAGKGGVHAHEHFVEGAGFMAQGGHWHIRVVDGDRLTIEHDENGQSRTVTKAELAAMLHAEHKAGIEKYEADKKERAQKRLEADRKEAAVYGTDAQRKRLGLPTKAEEAARAAKREAPKAPRGLSGKTASEVMESTGVGDIAKRAAEGSITAAEMRQAFEATLANKDAIMAQLAKLPKAELDRLGTGPKWGDAKKDTLIKDAWSGLLGRFHVSESMAWSPFTETYEDAVRREVGKLTDEAIAAYAARRKKAVEERQARIAALKEPQTLADFKARISMSREGERSLTPEQRVRYDELVAEDARAQAQKEHEDAHAARAKAAQERTALAGSALATETTAKVIPGKHTKHGHDIWTVQLADRLAPDEYAKANAHAKSLGGYYSSFRGNGAIPGFVFKTDEAARQFATKFGGSGGGSSGAAEAPAEVVPEAPGPLHGNAPARLREQANNAHERAQETLSADRKVNTARRAEMAAGAEANAMGEQAAASRMRLIADAQEAGTTKHLWGIKTRAHVEMLDNILRQAKYDRDRATREAGGKADHNETSHRAVTPEDIEHARPPEPSVHQDNIKGLAQALKDVPGAKQAAARVLKRISQLGEREWQLRATTEQERDDFKALADAGRLRGVETFAADDIRDQLTAWKRASEGMGIKSLPQLRAALREYVEITRGANKAKADPIKAAERALVGLKIPGYFPTPKPLADRVMQLANIKPGEKVLEPSAGKGSLADLAREQGGDVHVLEQHSGLRGVLSLKGHKVVGHDATDHAETYDKVVMNPPFEDGQDIDHVRHAFENNLKPGGKLVAIMSEGPFFRSDKKAQAFREWLESHGGTSEKNPEGSFKDSDNSTGVATRMVVITKAAPTAPKATTKEGRDPSHTAKLDEKIARLEREVARLGGETPHDKAMADSFPLGAGSMRPTGQRGGSNRRAEQRMDASIDRAKRHIEATRELNSLKARRAAYVEGRVNEQGRSIKPESVKTKSTAPRRTITDDQKRRGITKERAKLEAAAWAAKHKDFKGFRPDGTPDIMHDGGLVALGDLTDDELRKIAPKRMEKALRRLARLLR